MNDEEHDPLWTLLGKARQSKVSPFFASKVLRALREDGEPRPGIVEWLRRKWYVPIAAGACAVVFATLALRSAVGPAAPGLGADPLEEIAMAATATHENAASLETLLTTEDYSIWLAGDPASIY